MKSRRVVKEIIKKENLPQAEKKPVESRKKKYGFNSSVNNASAASATSGAYTVKETTLEKRVKRTYNT